MNPSLNKESKNVWDKINIVCALIGGIVLGIDGFLEKNPEASYKGFVLLLLGSLYLRSCK